jgi:hypothetical protein
LVGRRFIAGCFPLYHWSRQLIIIVAIHQGREFIANGALENGAFCTVFSENFHKF